MLFFLFLHGELIYNSSNLRSGEIFAVLIHSLARRNVIYKAKRKLSLISGYNSPTKRRLLLKKRKKKRTENYLKEKKRYTSLASSSLNTKAAMF